MAYRALIDFLDELEPAGELIRVGAPINTDLELAEIAGRMAGIGGPALLFSAVTGCRPAIVANLLATDARACRALGVNSLDQITQRIRDALAGERSGGWMERLRWSGAMSADRWQPRLVKTGACQQVVRHGTDVDLTTGPFLRSWPLEPARFHSSAIVMTLDPADRARLVDCCDVQWLDRNRLALLARPRRPVAQSLAEYRKRGERMPVAIVLGGDPAYRLLSVEALAMATGMASDPLALVGQLRDQAVELVKCRSMELAVPAAADMVLEGFVDPAEPMIDVGPVGLSNGFYSATRPAPVMHCVAATERTSPVCPVSVPGHWQGEPAVMQRVADRILHPLAQLIAPEVTQLCRPLVGGPHAYLFVAIAKSYAGQAQRVARALLGWPPLMTTKFVVIVDDDVHVADASAVWARVAAVIDPPRDISMWPGPADGDMVSADSPGLVGHTVVIDATAKIAGETAETRPGPLLPDSVTAELAESRWKQYGLPQLPGGSGAL